MVKSKLQKVIEILEGNKKLQDLFTEFDVDFDSTSMDLVNVLFKFDDIIQENTVYNLAEDPNEITGRSEKTKITCKADVANSLNSTYFSISTPNTNYYIWISTDSGVDPSPAGKVSIPISISTNSSAIVVATAITNVIVTSFSEYFTVEREGSSITITNKIEGKVNTAEDGKLPTNFTFNILEKGLDSSSSISALNEEISTAIELYPNPKKIKEQHNENYRSYTSTEGTNYTYLLKWIYYCYKYFNEDQFFFHNLLNNYVPSYDNEIISSTNYLKIYFDGLGILLDVIDQKIDELNTLANIDEIDENLLKYMAHLLGYQKEDFSIQNISFRELIKNLTEIYKRKGTEYSFKLFFKLLGFDAEIREYYWDRDAQNSEGFASIDETNYLYYLTTQNPRTRHRNQLSSMINSTTQQPINPDLWTETKDLRYFNELQLTYSLSEILGFKNSDINIRDKFTYFKSNFINFKLTQFYTKQDLTAKDTDTILKYVKFLTPIYVSAFVEVVTTPWEEKFTWVNPIASNLVLEGDPGDPNWIDILLPFVFVTLRDYIPINLMPASENAVIVAINGTQDLDFNGMSDSAMPVIFGNPIHGITITGVVNLSTPQNLTYANFINLKVDNGRGKKITVNGSNAQSFINLINTINNKFILNSINATASISPNPDLFPGPYTIRVSSKSLSMSSKIYMANGIIDDLFNSLNVTVLPPTDGNYSNEGYQEFATFSNPNNATGLTLNKEYNFYINVDDVGFSEVDISGPITSSTTSQQIIDSINNHYDKIIDTNFAISTTCQQLDMARLTNDKIVLAYRDVNSSIGRLIIMNPDGTVYKSGLSFSLVDVDLVTIAVSKDDSIRKFFVAFRELGTKDVKWLVFNYDGDKLTTPTIIEIGSGQGASLTDIVSTTLSNNHVVVVYNRASDSYVRIFDINNDSESEIGSGTQWQNLSMQEFYVETLGENFIISAKGGSGGSLVYLKNDGTFLLPIGSPTLPGSTKTFDNSSTIIQTRMCELANSNIIISWIDTNDNKCYFSIWNTNGTEEVSKTEVSSNTDLIKIIESGNQNINFIYHKTSDDKVYCRIYKQNGSLTKKDFLIYEDDTVTEITVKVLSTANMTMGLVVPNKGVFLNFSHLGDIATITNDNKLKLESIAAGATWDDNIENYAETSDLGHKFNIDGTDYEFDNYSKYYRTFKNSIFTDERNRFNTFFNTSPNDDIMPLIEDSLKTIFTILISVTERPTDSVDRSNFYIQRNGYINRTQDYSDIYQNGYMGKLTRHQDISEFLRTDSERIKKEINWLSWKNNETEDNDWSTWNLAIDYFKPQVNKEEPYLAAGLVVSSGSALTSIERIISGNITIEGSSDKNITIERSSVLQTYILGSTQVDEVTLIAFAGYAYPAANEESSIYDDGTNTIGNTQNIVSSTNYNNMYIVGSNNGRIASYDGNYWKKYDSSGSGTGPYNNSEVIGNIQIGAITNYLNYLIVIGQNGRVGSYDGNWKNYDGTGSGTGPYHSNALNNEAIKIAIEYNGKLIIGGESGKISSFDGVNWKLWNGTGTGTGPYSDGTQTSAGSSIEVATIFNNKIIFGTANGSIFSWDGLNWKNYNGTGSGTGPYGTNILGNSEKIYSLVVFNSILIVAGNYNRISSWDGLNWRYYNGSGVGSGIFNSSNSLLGNGAIIECMTVYDNKLIFGSSLGRIASHDGVNWKNYDGSGIGVGPFDNMTAIGSEIIYSLLTYRNNLIASGAYGRVAMYGEINV